MLRILIVILCTSIGVTAQWNIEDFNSMKCRNIGPAGMSGRITAIDVDLSNPSRICAGSASGGVWLSENGGTSWRPIFDEQNTLAIGSIKINQNNPSEIWVGTGEGNPRNSLNTGNGIYKTIDGGKTWKNMGLTKTKTIHRIIIHKDNPNIVFAASLGSPWGKNEDRGVFKTVDGGKTWNKILYVNDLTGAADMVVDPSNPNKMIVAMWEHLRQPWFFNSGGTGSGLYLTLDGGETWKRLTKEEGLPSGNLGRIGIAFSTNKPNIVYALVEATENGLYKSTDGGYNWSLVSNKNIGDRPFYYSELYVDPKNENRIFNVYTYVSMSEDGGKSFTNIADYGNNVHPDHHSFWIHPEDTNFLIDGNDGGLNISRDGGKTWQFAGNIPVGQFYHINVDEDFPYNVYGGMQDNGSWVGPSAVLKRGGIRNHDFQELYFGDGFDVVPNIQNSRYGYAMSQGGNVGYYDRETGRVRPVKPNHPDPKVELRFNWNTGIAQDPFHNCGVYFGSQYLHYSTDCGESWQIISPDLTTNDTTKQVADKSGGLTLDATNAENHTTILTIAPSKIQNGLIWVGTDDGNIQVTIDGGKTWTNAAKNIKGMPAGSWVAQIQASTYDKNEAWAVVNNYRRNDYSAYLFHTKDLGKTWRRVVDDKMIKGFVLSFVQDHKQPNLQFLGTDVGLHVSFDSGSTWHLWNKTIPQVQINDMVIHPKEDDLIIGTFGRAIWILDDINPLRFLARSGVDVLNKQYVLFESAPAYLASYKSYDGVRFTGQGEFAGDNKSLTTMYINLYNKPKRDSLDKVVKPSQELKASIKIYDNKHELVRNFKRTIQPGFQKIGWGLEANGFSFPSRRDSKPDDDPPGGLDVSPGWYTVVVSIDSSYVDSVLVEIKGDPRVEYDKNGEAIKSNMMKEFGREVDKSSKAFTFLKEAKKSVTLVDKILEMQTDSIKTKYSKLNKAITSTIDSLSNLFMSPENQKGIQRNPHELLSALYNAYGFINGSWAAPQDNALQAMNRANTLNNEVLIAVESFKIGKWAEYQDAVRSIPVVIFKEPSE